MQPTDRQPPNSDVSPTDAYRSLFAHYILGGLQQSLDRVRAAENLAPEAERVQAWHILSFALDVDAAWPLARDLLLVLAPKMEQAGFRDDWIAYLERGVQQSRRQDDRRGAAELCLHVGHLYRLKSDFVRADRWLTASLAGFQLCADAHGQARAQNQLAHVAYLQQRYAEARQLVESAFKRLPADDPERAVGCFVLGMIAIDHGQWEEAEAYHRQSLELRQRQGDPRGVAWSLQNIGYALRGQARYAEAIEYYDSAIALLDSMQDFVNQAIARMNLGVVYSLLQEPHEALRLYELAEAVLRGSQKKDSLAHLYTNMGLEHRALRNWHQAEQAFRQSIALWQRLSNVNWYLNALDGLGLVYLDQGRYSEACTVFTEAISNLHKAEDNALSKYLSDVLNKHLKKARSGKRSR